MSKFYKNIPESESFSFVFDKGLISTLNNFSFDFLGFDSLNSETKSSFGFLLSGGRVFDYKNRYVYSLNSDDQILISGNFINGCYANYSINGERIFSDKIFDSGNSFTGFSLKYDDGAFDDCSFVVGVGDNNCDIYYDKYIESFIGKKSYSNIRIGSVENKLLINDVYIPDFAINRRFFSLTGLQNYQFPIYLDKSGFIDIQLIISELNRDQYNWIPLFIDTQFGVVKKNITLERSIKKKYLINETIDYSGLYSENKAIIKSLISSNFLFTDYDFNISGIIITGVDAYSGKAIDDITGFYNNETNDLESGRYSGFYSGFYSEQSSGFYSGFLYDEITELYSGVYSDNYNDFPSGFYSGFYSGLAFVAKYTRPVNDIYVSNGESALMPNVFYDGHISGISCLVLKNEKYTNTGSFILDSQPKNRLYLSTVIGFDNTLSYPLTGEFLYRFRAFYSDNDYATFTGGFSIEYLNSNEIKINKK